MTNPSPTAANREATVWRDGWRSLMNRGEFQIEFQGVGYLRWQCRQVARVSADLIGEWEEKEKGPSCHDWLVLNLSGLRLLNTIPLTLET